MVKLVIFFVLVIYVSSIVVSTGNHGEDVVLANDIVIHGKNILEECSSYLHQKMWNSPPPKKRLMWTFLKGHTSSYTAVAGTMFDDANAPYYHQGPAFATVSNNEIGLRFGGSSSGYKNDLWAYKFSTLQWRFVVGTGSPSNPTFHTDSSIYHADNMPPALYTATAQAIDNVFYLFHGKMSGGWDDVWALDYDLELWRHVVGTKSVNQAAIYGTGTFDGANHPAGMYNVISKKYGGSIYTFSGCIAYSTRPNDIWEFSPSLGQWRHVKGSKIPNVPSSYLDNNNVGVYHADNYPSGRFGATSWIVGDEWYIFGSIDVNDFWAFDFTTSQWKLVVGDLVNHDMNYGIQDEYGPDTIPPRYFGAGGFQLNDDELVLIGGYGYIYCFDFMFYSLDYNLSPNNLVWIFSISQGQWRYNSGFREEYVDNCDYSTAVFGQVEERCVNTTMPFIYIEYPSWEIDNKLLVNGYMDQIWEISPCQPSFYLDDSGVSPFDPYIHNNPDGHYSIRLSIPIEVFSTADVSIIVKKNGVIEHKTMDTVSPTMRTLSTLIVLSLVEADVIEVSLVSSLNNAVALNKDIQSLLQISSF